MRWLRHFARKPGQCLSSSGKKACGTQEPAKNEKRKCKPTGASIHAVELSGKPDTPLPPLTANAPLLEEGLHRELLGMPPLVAAFLWPTPRDLPWRNLESEAERAHREVLEFRRLLDWLSRIDAPPEPRVFLVTGWHWRSAPTCAFGLGFRHQNQV
jgi:hypothetical protein